MKKGEKEKDALLGDEGAKLNPPATPTPPAKVENKAIPVNKLTGKRKEVLEALAKFPTDIVAQTKYILDNSEHINFILPLADGEQQGSAEPVQINGYKLWIRKGDMVNIPIQIANILANKYKIAMKAGIEKRLDQSPKDVQEALG